MPDPDDTRPEGSRGARGPWEDVAKLVPRKYSPPPRRSAALRDPHTGKPVTSRPEEAATASAPGRVTGGDIEDQADDADGLAEPGPADEDPDCE